MHIDETKIYKINLAIDYLLAIRSPHNPFKLRPTLFVKVTIKVKLMIIIIDIMWYLSGLKKALFNVLRIEYENITQNVKL